MMKNKIVYASVAVLVCLLLIFMLTGCDSKDEIEVNVKDGMEKNNVAENNTNEVGIDFFNAETFEKALNDGQNVDEKIVKFIVTEYHPKTLTGHNAWAGEHLNFISKDDLKLNSNDEVTCRIISVDKKLGSWYIDYEVIEINKNEIGNNTEIQNENVTDKNEISEIIYYEYDETINKYVTLYNNMYPDNKITSDMLSIYHHHGSDHKEQAKLILEDLFITISSGWGEQISIYIENSKDDNVIIKNLIKKFVKVFDNSITDEKIDQYIDSQGGSSSIDTYDGIEYLTNKNLDGTRIEYIKITGKLK